MTMLFAALAWAASVAWLLARAIAQFRHYETIGPDQPPGDVPLPALGVVVPARDEEANIERCLRGLLGQDYPADRLRLVVVDDNSRDRTAEIVRRLAERAAGPRSDPTRDPPLSLVEGAPLPEGWFGKPHACRQGAAAAGAADWLCFVDADTAAEPALLRSAVAAAQARRADMLSLEPRQELGSFWERLLIPCGLLVLAFTQDLRRANDPARPDAVANGQFILIRREVYEAVGGHEAVRDEIAEDTALARRVKAAGGRLAILGGESLIRTRMYTGLPSLWQGISKNLVTMVGGLPTAMLMLFVAPWLVAAAVLLPAWTALALVGQPLGGRAVAAAVLAWAASLALLGIHLGTARHLRIPLWCAVLFPVGYLVGAAIGVHSVIKHLRGRAEWKGRQCSFPPAAGGRPTRL